MRGVGELDLVCSQWKYEIHDERTETHMLRTAVPLLEEVIKNWELAKKIVFLFLQEPLLLVEY